MSSENPASHIEVPRWALDILDFPCEPIEVLEPVAGGNAGAVVPKKSELASQINELKALSEMAVAPELKADLRKRAADLHRLAKRGPENYIVPDLPEFPPGIEPE